ncbi:MAG: HAMP domain-containing protein [Gammaproteobacteria bacterium]|jgi:nitrogen fixation/metabolism regulation signal transduction histidine kinase|nr:HAMP domain-containing protein [Gammaproteobacteria bacterium]MBU0773176.1 HAMP domain-containing protein [Gammaproteobacteria bacterium]MBU0855425.1 HAMP domain-containing protein [Gammaproteobacteria bacterium]MBU1848911.1 HAMP domain-containing protein [Gammaproteobacteria bacterium]
MRLFIVASTALSGVLLLLLSLASENTTLFASSYPLLLSLNIGVAVGLLGLVAWLVSQLLRDHRAAVFGSRLKLRLFAAFAALAVAPGALLYVLSVNFVSRSVDSWFNVRIEQALEGGLILGRNTLDYLSADLLEKARTMARDLADTPSIKRSARLDLLREQSGAASATLFSAQGTVLSTSSGETRLVPPLPTPSQLRQARQGLGLTTVETDDQGGLTVHALVFTGGASLTSDQPVLQLTQPLPSSLALNAEAVQSAYRDYQELSLARVGLKRIFALTLTLALLLALLSALAVAFVISRRMSAPLSILARGTDAVMQGDFSPIPALATRDELGTLTQSFRRMTQQLDEARAQAERSRAETEAARTYLEGVLGNLSAGVLAFGPSTRLRAANQGALAILSDRLEGWESLSLAQWPRHPELRDAIVAAIDDGQESWSRQIDINDPFGPGKTLLLRGSQLPQAGGGGFVVVFDDITQLISAQRSAAWGEVARRLAHEIKNPLTPIQLSAERLQFKLSDKLDADGQRMLMRATTTIVDQVEAMKNMVNAFRDYARLPQPVIAPLDLNELVDEVLALYETSPARIDRQLAPELPDISGDAGQLRQVIHNLLQNAQDALAETADPQISIQTRRRGTRAELTVRDNGGGFPPQVLTRAFEPYVTSKARGTGLGLAIVKKIVDEHDGRIEIGNIAPHGAEIRIALPLAA